MITGATILCFSFTGFDGISNLSEETKDAERVIPRAIFLTALIGGMIFIFATYFLQLYFPDISRFKDPDASQPEIMLYVAGKAFRVGALIFHHYRTGVRYGGARRRSASDVRNGA